MNNAKQPSDPIQPAAEKRLTFDQYVQQLPESKQAIHRWLVWLVAAAFIITLGVFVYAIYTSFAWKTVGGINVVNGWMYFFLAGAVGAFLLGLDTLILGATIPLPFGGAKYNFELGPKVALEGWGLIAYGVIMALFVVLSMTTVRAGILRLEDWIKLFVGFWVIVGLAAGLLAILRRFLRTV